jgi:Flp pilus assembly protein TadD
MSLGLTRLRMNRIEEAEQCIRRAIELRPEGRGYRFALGVLLKGRGDLEGALEQFRLELASSPDEAATRRQIAEVEAEMRTRSRN